VVAGLFSNQIGYILRTVQPFLEAGETVAFLHPKGWFRFVRQELQHSNIAYCEITQANDWPTGPELVALSTIHSAKGLEFDHVMIPGLSSEVTPHGVENGDGTLDSLSRLVAMGIGRARRSVTIGYKPGEESTLISRLDPSTYDFVEV
jgi:superfamily I DNA/RNA helicase